MFRGINGLSIQHENQPAKNYTEIASNVFTGVVVAFCMINYFALDGKFGAAETFLSSLNVAMATLAIGATVYRYAKLKEKENWQEMAKKVLFFGAVLTLAILGGFTGALSSSTMGWLNLTPLIALGGYKLYSCVQKNR